MGGVTVSLFWFVLAIKSLDGWPKGRFLCNSFPALLNLIDRRYMVEQVTQASQDYIEALSNLNSVLKPMGLQMPLPLAVRIGKKPPRGCILLSTVCG